MTQGTRGLSRGILSYATPSFTPFKANESSLFLCPSQPRHCLLCGYTLRLFSLGCMVFLTGCNHVEDRTIILDDGGQNTIHIWSSNLYSGLCQTVKLRYIPFLLLSLDFSILMLHEVTALGGRHVFSMIVLFELSLFAILGFFHQQRISCFHRYSQGIPSKHKTL